LKQSLSEREGADNAGKSLILEEGMSWETFSASARDSQMIELRKFQVEECSRVTGVPRPLLMVDDTSWGSGIGELGRFFVTYGLNPHFEAWGQAAERSLLDSDEKGRYAIKFNAGALLRGSMKDQADWFSKALGMGGGKPWAKQNEVRDMLDWPADSAASSDQLGVANSAPAPAAFATEEKAFAWLEREYPGRENNREVAGQIHKLWLEATDA
jgi:HK97 family phage portal protein